MSNECKKRADVHYLLEYKNSKRVVEDYTQLSEDMSKAIELLRTHSRYFPARICLEQMSRQLRTVNTTVKRHLEIYKTKGKFHGFEATAKNEGGE